MKKRYLENQLSINKLSQNNLDIKRLFLTLFLSSIIIAFSSGLSIAQTFTFDFGEEPSSTGRIIQFVAILTILSLAPSILIMMTSFTRIVVVLSFLRSALGVQTTPPNIVIISLALFLTGFIMAPTLEKIYDDSLLPLMENDIDEMEAYEKGKVPVHNFMMSHVREDDLKLFMDMTEKTVSDPKDTSLRVLIPAFMISELRRAFEIGFLLFLPFLIIDMVVASVLMSMGMMMLPPVLISLPFKLIFFVLIDGWHMIAGSLVKSYTG